MWNRKTKAFTLYDMLISMILVMLLVSMGMLAFGIIEKEYTRYRSREQALQDVMYLQSFLDHQFRMNAMITGEDKHLVFCNNKDTSASIWLDTNRVIIIQPNRTDTLLSAIRDCHVSYTEDLLVSELIKRFSCTVTVNRQDYFIAVSKEYGADTYMNREAITN